MPNSSELQVLGNWRRSLRTSGLQDSLALGLQNLQALDQKLDLQRLGRSSELSVQSLQMLLGKSSEHADAYDLLIFRSKSSEALLDGLWLALATSDFVTSA